MSKRVAGIQLTADNAEQIEGEEEEAGAFQVATEAELKKRVIKTARRGRTMEGQSKGTGGIFANLKSLSASMARPTKSESSTSSMDASLPAGRIYTFGSSSSGVSSTTVSSITSVTSAGDTSESIDKSLSKSSKYMEKLRELNLSVSSWISQNVKGNPYVDLSPIFNDYKAYWKSIESTYDDSSTTDSGILTNDTTTNSSTVAEISPALMSEGTGVKLEQKVCPLCGSSRHTTEEDYKPVGGAKLPTVTLSLKGAGNWNVHVPREKALSGGTSGGTSEQSSSSQSSTTGSFETAQSSADSKQQTTSTSATDTSFTKDLLKVGSQQVASSTTDSSSYTALKAGTASGKPLSALPTLRTGTTASQFSSSMTTETKFDTKTAGTTNAPQPLSAGNKKGFLLSQHGVSAGSATAPSFGTKPTGNPLKPISATFSSMPASSFPVTQDSSTIGNQPTLSLPMPLTTDNSFVGSTAPSDLVSGILPTTQTATAVSQLQGAATPTLSTAPTDRNGDSQDEESVATKTADAEDDSLYSSRAKLFYKKEDEFVELGVGTLKVEAYSDKVARVLLRNDSSLKKVILNISVTSQVPLTLTKNNLLVLCPEPNPPLNIEVRPVGYLIRVKTPADAQRLLDAINSQTGNS